MASDLNTYLTRFLYSRLPKFGAGSASGVLTVSTTSAQTAADTNETDLWTYSLPASTLDVNGRALRVTAFGTTAANANNKTLTLYLGSEVLRTNTAAINAQNWLFTATIIRSGAAAEIAITEYRQGATVINPAYTQPSQDTTAAIIIKVTGTNGTASAGDIVFKGAIVEILN